MTPYEAVAAVGNALPWVACGGCVALGYAAYRIDRANAKLRADNELLRAALLERRRNRRAAGPDGPPPHLRADVVVHVPPAIDETRLDLARWQVPTSEQMGAWVRRASSGRESL